MVELDEIWEGLLSRQSELVRKAYAILSQDEQAVVIQHLIRMVEEPGWHIEQRTSARAALQALFIDGSLNDQYNLPDGNP